MKVTVKILAVICALLMVISLASCGKKADTQSGADANSAAASDTKGEEASSGNPIVGSWEYETGGYTYVFNEDGTGVYQLSSGDMKFTYEIKDGNVLSILYDGNTDPMELEFEIDGDRLNVKDSFGSDTIYIKK